MEQQNTPPSLATIIGMMQGRLKAVISFLDDYDQMSRSTQEFMIDNVKKTLQNTIDDAEQNFQLFLDQYKNK